jgi:hypothetical protein
MRTPFTVMAVLLVLLTGLALVTDDGDEPETASTRRAAPFDVIVRRVEALRELRFDRRPRPVRVSPEQARREGLEDFDRSYPPARRRDDETILKRLGLMEPDDDLREIVGSLFGEGVAGYYDPRSERLRVVTGAGTTTPVLAEMVLAHELTHALEDQEYGLDAEDLTGSDDRVLARQALIEGTATMLMSDYADRHFTVEETLGGALASAFAPTGDLPPFLQAQTLFAYIGGEQFVRRLRERAGGGWQLVDVAQRLRPPSSTEQIMHPDAYFDADEPARVRLEAGRVLGPGWKRAAAGTWGELQTRELLARAGGGGSAAAAAGWGGDRYELWRSGDRDALIMRWRWDTPADATEFAERLQAFAEVTPAGRGVYVHHGPGSVTLAIAPTGTLAERLARLS